MQKVSKHPQNAQILAEGKKSVKEKAQKPLVLLWDKKIGRQGGNHGRDGFFIIWLLRTVSLTCNCVMLKFRHQWYLLQLKQGISLLNVS